MVHMTLRRPLFLEVAAHPLRWDLLLQLSRSDQRVDDLAQFLGKPRNLVSYHLARLRHAGFVSGRRSSMDRRDVYYRLNVSQCGEFIDDALAALHPALRLCRPFSGGPGMEAEARVPTVLFLCTENSARSQIAEGLMRAMCRGSINAASAGTRPTAIHPRAIRVMKARGLDVNVQRSKHVDEYRGTTVDVVVTVCDRVKEEPINFLGSSERLHWSLPDPVAAEAREASDDAFEATVRELEWRIAYLRSWVHRQPMQPRPTRLERV